MEAGEVKVSHWPGDLAASMPRRRSETIRFAFSISSREGFAPCGPDFVQLTAERPRSRKPRPEAAAPVLEANSARLTWRWLRFREMRLASTTPLSCPFRWSEQQDQAPGLPAAYGPSHRRAARRIRPPARRPAENLASQDPSSPRKRRSNRCRPSSLVSTGGRSQAAGALFFDARHRPHKPPGNRHRVLHFPGPYQTRSSGAASELSP